jgi:hypothetical protein
MMIKVIENKQTNEIMRNETRLIEDYESANL